MLASLKTFSGRNPSQHPHELSGFISLLLDEDARRYLEIGARHGDTFHAIMCALPPGSTGVAVDLPGGLWGTPKSVKALRRAVDDLNRRGYHCSVVFGDSHTAATARLIQSRGPYDAVLIDGDHTLEGVTRDYELYGRVAPLVAFHDIAGTGQAERVNGRPVEVPVLWERLKRERTTVEYVAAGSKMGIGVLCDSIS